MSVATTQTQTADVQTAQTPDDKRLHSLAVEASKYLGLNVGEPLPTAEIFAQAKANGYEEGDDFYEWLEGRRLDEVSEIPVPPQGDVLGELWRVENSTTKAPNPAAQTLESFRDWCEDKRQMRRQEYDDGEYQHSVEHAYSYKSERQKFVRAKDVERWFIEECDRFTTILITYTHPRSSDESIVEHAQGFYPEYPIQRKRRECIKATGYWDEYAGVSLLAPKDVAPNPTAQATHAHDALVIPSFVSSECFDPLRAEDDVDVSIQYHRSDKVEAPPAVNRSDLERERGATTALAQEVGANLPVLTAIESLRDKVEAEASINSARYEAALDATDCPDYVERWSACMRIGEQDIEIIGTDKDSGGVQRWTPLGRFNEIADSMKDERDYGAMGVGAKDSGESISDESHDSTEGGGTSRSPEGTGESDTNHSTESRFNFTGDIEEDSSGENQFSFTE